MKITKNQLKNIISEELDKLVQEVASMPSSPLRTIVGDTRYAYQINNDGTYTAFDTQAGNKPVYTGSKNIDRVMGGRDLSAAETMNLGFKTDMPSDAGARAADRKAAAEMGKTVGADPQFGGGSLNVYGSGAPSQYDTALGPTDVQAAYGALGDIVMGDSPEISAKDFRSATRGQARKMAKMGRAGMKLGRAMDRGAGEKRMDKLQKKFVDAGGSQDVVDLAKGIEGAGTAFAGERMKDVASAKDVRKAGRQGFRALKNIEKEFGSPEEMRAMNPEGFGE